MIEKHVQTEKGKVVYWTTKEWNSERRTLFFFHGIIGFEFEVIKGAGHNANVDNPKEMNKIIYDFIKNNII